MEDKKLAAIQAAYGDAWEKVKNHVMSPANKGFWCCIPPYEAGFDGEIEQYRFSSWRPEVLSGIEDNNGWMRLDEKEPTLGDYYVCRDGEFDGGILHSHEITLPGNPYDVTHWRLIERPKPPIY